MRALGLALATTFALVAGSAGCVPDKNKEAEWQKPPKEWDTKGDSLTFGSKNLDAFTAMSTSEREAHIAALQSKAGSFLGQGKFRRGSELGEQIEDRVHGVYEVYAVVEEPVLYEITIEYRLFSTGKQGDGLPTGTYVEFSGTLVDVAYQENSKPRKLEIKVKDVEVKRLAAM